MADSRILAQLQHAIQYPSGHLDRFAQFGPSFEMDGASAGAIERASDRPVSSAIQPDQPVSQAFDAKRFITAGRATGEYRKWIRARLRGQGLAGVTDRNTGDHTRLIHMWRRE